MIVPVPLHPAKQREREFNQAERLADRLGAATQIPVNKRLLRRVVAHAHADAVEAARSAWPTSATPLRMRDGQRLNGERIVLRGRRFHDGRDDQRLRPGADGRPGRAKFASGQLPAEFEYYRAKAQNELVVNMKGARRAGNPRSLKP